MPYIQPLLTQPTPRLRRNLPTLPVLLDALAYDIRHEILIAPPQHRENAEQLAEIERRDVEERLMGCVNEDEAIALVHRWCKTYEVHI